MTPATAQSLPPQAPVPIDLGWSGVLMDLMFLLPVALMLIFLWPVLKQSWSGFSFMRRQEQYLDHQQAATDRIVAQNDAVQRSVEEQYARANALSQQALAQPETALKVQGEMLAELKAMKTALDRLAARA